MVVIVYQLAPAVEKTTPGVCYSCVPAGLSRLPDVERYIVRGVTFPVCSACAGPALEAIVASLDGLAGDDLAETLAGAAGLAASRSLVAAA
jgi:predicted metal-binding protein